MSLCGPSALWPLAHFFHALKLIHDFKPAGIFLILMSVFRLS
jgi:hypothetical protein